MDCRSIQDPATQLRELFDRLMLRVNTCMPGTIASFDPATQTATVIPAIQMQTRVDDRDEYIDLPPIINAPVVYPLAASAGFAITLPFRPGDPCVLVFSQRAIDNWHERGGTQPPEDGPGCRHHDLTDAFVFPAAAPLPMALDNWEEDGLQLRNVNGTTKLTVKDDEISLTVGNVVFKVTATGVTVAGGTFKGPGNVDLLLHTHNDPQGGKTGGPVT